MQFVLCTQVVGMVLAGVWVAASADPIPRPTTLAAAAGAGLGLTCGLAAFFKAMVVDKMSLVAPVAATGAAVPIIAAVAAGARLLPLDIVGILAAVGGVSILGRNGHERPELRSISGLRLSLLAAFGGGMFLWLMAPASRHDVPWALLIARTIPALTLGAAVARRHASLRVAAQPRNLIAILVAGVLGFSAVALYALATRNGPLAVVSVLASLYPVVTILLAQWLVGERVCSSQRVGMASVLAGVVLLSVGGPSGH
jgi:drug/metabolite transporter (DMT)-like permease